MPYSENQIDELLMNASGVAQRANEVMLQYCFRDFKNEKAREFARHGFARRILTLARCVERVFEVIPPNQIEIPHRESVKDAEVYIQTMLFNVFGCIDNLAWIWVLETGVSRPDGKPLKPVDIGLRPNNKRVRRSFSIEFQHYLASCNEWFEYLEGYRHALAHQIPPYIPPYMIDPTQADEYRSLGEKASHAFEDGDLAKYEDLQAEQMNLAHFDPVVAHSLFDGDRPVRFHPQVIADFMTVDELSRRIAQELGQQKTRS
ncbi:MAG: hypothetical protein P1U69_11160 [Parvibaculaceae bacterium]|nr:hypothetical protein [Parvibaculaceae bacterium]HBM87410.1 hypothetical protein [Rhodobiaceae bacterium]